MAAGFQTTVPASPRSYQVGVPTQALLRNAGGSSIGYDPNGVNSPAGILVGGPAYGIAPDLTATNAVDYTVYYDLITQDISIANTTFVGIVLRSNSAGSAGYYNNGSTYIIPSGTSVEYLQRGSVPVALSSAQVTANQPAVGHALWVKTPVGSGTATLGDFITAPSGTTGTSVAGYSETNFRVLKIINNVSGAYQVLVSNTQNVLK